MLNTDKIITIMNENKDVLSPKQRKRLINIQKDLQGLTIDIAQSMSGKSITSYREAIDYINKKY